MNRRTLTIIGVAAVVVLLVGLAMGIALYSTSQPSFFARYGSLEYRYDTLKGSFHKNLACSDCHSDKRGPIAYRLALVGDFYASLLTKQRMPIFTKIDQPTRAACLNCHKLDWSMYAARTKKVPHPAHLKVMSEPRDCVSCHRWTAHEEGYMLKHKTMPFSGLCVAYGCHSGWKSTEQCDKCHHVLHSTPGEWKKQHPKTVNAMGANGCVERCHTAEQCVVCHTTGKTPKFTGLEAKSGLEDIQTEHVKKNWLDTHGLLALKDKSKCLQCHVSEDECKDCHQFRPAFHGPSTTWLARHKEFAKKNRAACLACHKASWCKNCHAQFKETR